MNIFYFLLILLIIFIYLNNKKIINPGSVGQPRNGQPGAHWVLLDTVTMATEHRVEKYDIESVVQQCKEYAPNHPYLYEVLRRK